jgi:SAM-dependent methyltransferase
MMPEDRRSLGFLIDEICAYLVGAGITEHDDELIREAAQNVAQLIGVVRRPSDVSGVGREPAVSPPCGKHAYTKEEIDRLNKAAEVYFRAMKDPSCVLNKPMSGIFDPPVLLYRFSVLLAGLEVGLHTVLDFGAGSCWVSSLLNRMGCRTIALDVSETALRYGRRLFELDRRHRMDLHPQFLVFDGYTFPLRDETIDRIICFDAFHHVPNKGDILREMYRVLKRGGKVGFSEPGSEHSKSPMSVYAMETHGVLESDIDLDEFIRTAGDVGFDDVLIKPYPPPESIAFSVPEYRRFVNGENGAFPLNIIREDLKRNTNVILEKGKAVWDSRRPNVLKAGLRIVEDGPKELKAGQQYTFQVETRNAGDTVWLSSPNPVGGFVTLGAHLYNATNEALDLDYGRAHLARDVRPWEKQRVDISLVAPQQEGVYFVELDMVCEMICWFAQRGSDPIRQPIAVV